MFTRRTSNSRAKVFAALRLTVENVDGLLAQWCKDREVTAIVKGLVTVDANFEDRKQL